MSNAGARIEYLDGWRGLAILLVLGGHFLFIKGVALGPFGVEVFFVLSGRLMAEILFVQQFPLGKFYQRRISRIYPALLAFVSAAMILFRVDDLSAFRALTFTYNYAGSSSHMLDHVWSLCVEEHAYLILGGVAYLGRRFGLKPLPVLWAMAMLSMADGIVSETVLHQNWFQAYWRTDAHVGSIFVSAALYLSLRGRAVPAWASPALAALALALNLSGVPQWVSYSLGTAVLAGSLATLPATYPILLRGLSLRPLTFMGLLSYSVYLWQQPLYQMAFGHHKLYALGLMALALAAGFVSFNVVEQPARKALNRLAERAFRPRVASPAA